MTILPSLRHEGEPAPEPRGFTDRVRRVVNGHGGGWKEFPWSPFLLTVTIIVSLVTAWASRLSGDVADLDGRQRAHETWAAGRSAEFDALRQVVAELKQDRAETAASLRRIEALLVEQKRRGR